MKTKYSLIIPAFNAEKTISRCLESILQNERTDIEVIIIDDGSNDYTHEACLPFIQDDRRVKYLFKENEGVSSARNKGLEIASGTFICFVDSDDFVSKDYFFVLDELTDADADLYMFGRQIYDGEELKKDEYKECYIKGKNNSVDFLINEYRYQKLNFVCDKIFKRDMVKRYNILFPLELSIGEDKVFVTNYITNVNSVKCSKRAIYVSSVENKNSLSRKVRKDLISSVLKEHEILNRLIKQSQVLSKEQKNKFYSSIDFSFYRSAYTVFGETEKFIQEIDRVDTCKYICKTYKEYKTSRENGLDFKSYFLSLPIRLEMISLIYFIWHHKG